MALMQARSGVARSDATRSDYFYGFLALTIGGVDRASAVKQNTTKITDALNEQSDTASLVVFGFDPTTGQEIIIGNGAINNRVFGGTIVRARQLSVRKAAAKFWQLDCTDYTWLLNRRLVTKTYSAQAAHLMVIDIITNFASGFTTANVKAGSPTVQARTFKATRVGDAIAAIAIDAGWNWYPDYTKDIHFFDTETTQAPLDLTATNLTYDELAWNPSIDQIRTRVFVEGGGGKATAPIAVGATALAVDECGWYGATGGTVVSGSNLITYTGQSAASGPGTLTGVPASGAGSVVTAIRQGDAINIWVQCDDAAAQAALAAAEGGDGIHEFPIVDSTLRSIAEATARGNAELALFSTADNTGEYLSRDKFNRSGKSVTVTLPARGISATILQQQVVRQYEAQGKWVFRVKFRRIRQDFFKILLQLHRSVTKA